MPAREYEFYLGLFNSISREWAVELTEYEKIKFEYPQPGMY